MIGTSGLRSWLINRWPLPIGQPPWKEENTSSGQASAAHAAHVETENYDIDVIFDDHGQYITLIKTSLSAANSEKSLNPYATHSR